MNLNKQNFKKWIKKLLWTTSWNTTNCWLRHYRMMSMLFSFCLERKKHLSNLRLEPSIYGFLVMIWSRPFSLSLGSLWFIWQARRNVFFFYHIRISLDDGW